MKTALALGTFDGVHLGHKAVLNMPNGYKKIAVIFSIPPKAVLSGEPRSIMTVDTKIKTIKELGIDEVYTLEFEKIKDMLPFDFLCFLKNEFSPSYISCGFNYRFGKNATGNTEILSRFCKENDIILKCNEPVCVSNEPVSSTRIRECLKTGEIELANKLLTQPFSFKAEVIEGDKRGRTIGFPTINQKYPSELIPIRFGVYKAKVKFDNKEYKGIVNVGIRPTFESKYIISETYIIDFSGDVYGKDVEIEPIKFIRDEVRFSSVKELKQQIALDIKK